MIGARPRPQPRLVAVSCAALLAGITVALNLIGHAAGWYMGSFTGYIVLLGFGTAFFFYTVAYWAAGQTFSESGVAHRAAATAILFACSVCLLFSLLLTADLVVEPFRWDHDTFPQKVHAWLFPVEEQEK